MQLGKWFNLRRYRRCRGIFRRPARVHVQSTSGARRPLVVEMLAGGSIEIDDVRRCRPMFDWLLEQSPDPLPVTADSGLVTFHHQGWRISLRPSGPEFVVFREIFWEDVYGIERLPQRLGTIVDLGANVGLFTLRVAARAERIVSVEPVAANFALAGRNIAQAGLSDRVTLRRLAVAGESGKTTTIHLGGANSGSHSIVPDNVARWNPAGSEMVPTISLPDLFESEGIGRCSLLKCDVEGAEFEVFRAVGLDVLARIDRIVMEVHLGPGSEDADQFGGLCEKLRSAGFRVQHGSLDRGCGKLQSRFMLTADLDGNGRR